MNISFTPKESDKAYISNKLWLPKSKIRINSVKQSLEFTTEFLDKEKTVILWEESSKHIICPREFLSPSVYGDYPFPFIDLRPSFGKVKFEDKVTLRDEDQNKAWEVLSKHNNGILNLACGKGKTILALKKIAQKGVPTLIIVPDGGILSQWKESILGDKKEGKPSVIGFDGELGLVQGPVFDWARPITLALVTTLALRIRDNVIPENFFRYFGFIVYDEVHLMGAPVFSLTAAPFYGDRLGLTATVQREDGLDPIYRFNIGEIFYSDLKQDLIPKIFFQKTSISLPFKDAMINDMVNISVLRTKLGTDLTSNIYRYYCIKNALDTGRKILCLSHSKAQLRLFHAMFPDSGLIIQNTPKKDRMRILRDSRICFAIAKLGSTGIDDSRLDTLFWLTPFKSKNSLQQSMGRVQRTHPEKKNPMVVVFDDILTPPLKKLCLTLKRSLRSWKYKFQSLPPLDVPKTLPKDVKERYQNELKNI